MRWNARATPAGPQQCEMMRDEAANDNMGPAEREAIIEWATQRMSQREWRAVAIQAMMMAQRR